MHMLQPLPRLAERQLLLVIVASSTSGVFKKVVSSTPVAIPWTALVIALTRAAKRLVLHQS